ncbi:MAG: catalase [Vulcanimicrobiota bacterium]
MSRLDPFKSNPDHDHLTTNQGIKVPSNQDSLKAGERGPSLMEDFFFREKMTHFDHERIPERVVHARGFGAHGVFEVYESLEDITCARFLCEPDRQTPVFVRFSTVAGNKGSAETVRDVRGFATKFYTDEGNFDLVGNNIPIFFIQDAIKFPDLIHAVKAEPHNNMPQAASAHETFYDFCSLMPESMAMLMWLFSDRAIPRSVRMMEGFGIHTFRLLNAKGESKLVKFHWKPVLGMASLVWEEAQKIAGLDADFLNRDLWTAIENGDFPEWEFGLQIFTEEEAAEWDFDILDPTKIVPEELVPVRRVGKMTLNRNVDNFFAETEQIAFHPGHVVPGIDFTNDPLLQGRLFSYTDTQLIRLGGPNFAEIPINRPRASVNNNQRDGYGRQTINPGQVAYEPNMLAGGCPFAPGAEAGAFRHFAEKIEAHKVRARSPLFKVHFRQATLFWNSQTSVEQQHIIDAASFELGMSKSENVRQRMVNLLYHVSEELANGVASKLGLPKPDGDLKFLEHSPAPSPSDTGQRHDQKSDALSIEKNKAATVSTRRVAILVEAGVDKGQVEKLFQALQSQGAEPVVVGPHFGHFHGLAIDDTYHTAAPSLFDGTILAGGQLEQNPKVATFVKDTYEQKKPLGGLAEGARVLISIGLAVKLSEGKCVSEHGVVTAGADQVESFGHKFLEALAEHRHWQRPAPSLLG